MDPNKRILHILFSMWCPAFIALCCSKFNKNSITISLQLL